MISSTLLFLVFIGSLLRQLLPFLDMFWLVFLVIMFSNPDKRADVIKTFALGSFVASLFGGVFIGLLPLITCIVFFLVTRFTDKQMPKGLPTILTWSGIIAIILAAEGVVISLLSTGVFTVHNQTFVRIIWTIMGALLISFFTTRSKKL